MRKTLNEGCIVIDCANPPDDPHEGYYGRNRKLSIKYGMVVAICREHHRYVHDNPKCEIDMMIRNTCREHFEKHNPTLDFRKVFI